MTAIGNVLGKGENERRLVRYEPQFLNDIKAKRIFGAKQYVRLTVEDWLLTFWTDETSTNDSWVMSQYATGMVSLIFANIPRNFPLPKSEKS